VLGDNGVLVGARDPEHVLRSDVAGDGADGVGGDAQGSVAVPAGNVGDVADDDVGSGGGGWKTDNGDDTESDSRGGHPIPRSFRTPNMSSAIVQKTWGLQSVSSGFSPMRSPSGRRVCESAQSRGGWPQLGARVQHVRPALRENFVFVWVRIG